MTDDIAIEVIRKEIEKKHEGTKCHQCLRLLLLMTNMKLKEANKTRRLRQEIAHLKVSRRYMTPDGLRYRGKEDIEKLEKQLEQQTKGDL